MAELIITGIKYDAAAESRAEMCALMRRMLVTDMIRVFKPLPRQTGQTIQWFSYATNAPTQIVTHAI